MLGLRLPPSDADGKNEELSVSKGLNFVGRAGTSKRNKVREQAPLPGADEGSIQIRQVLAAVALTR